MLSSIESFLRGAGHVVVIGMGNELRADDGVGLEVVRLLKPHEGKNLKVFEGHMTPDAFIAPACATRPTHILIVDAAELGEQPGKWRLLFPHEVKEGMFTTHAIPVTTISTEIQRRCRAKAAFIGIQPKERTVALTLSQEARISAQDVADIIRRTIQKIEKTQKKQSG